MATAVVQPPDRKAISITSHRESLYILYDDWTVLMKDKYDGNWYSVNIPQ